MCCTAVFFSFILCKKPLCSYLYVALLLPCPLCLPLLRKFRLTEDELESIDDGLRTILCGHKKALQELVKRHAKDVMDWKAAT